MWLLPKNSITILALATVAISATDAATLVSSSFTAEGATSAINIDTQGANITGWGYYDESYQINSDSAFSNTMSGGIVVTAVNGAIANATAGNQTKYFTFLFDDGVSPTTGPVTAGGQFGAWAPTEDNASTLTFSNLGVGTHTVRMFVGHSSNDRVFDMDYSVTASDGNFSGNTASNLVGSDSLHATYEIVFSTTDANADLELQFNSTSGGTGSGMIAGYTVETIPEPSVISLAGIAGLLLARRRRS